MALTKIDRKALAILYCLYGHESFVWAGKGKFQWYFGVTNRAKNRLVKMGFLQCREMQYAPHWLAYRDICQISSCIKFDDKRIQDAITKARDDLIAKGYDYTKNYKPYAINNPEYRSFIEVPVNAEFQALIATLSTQSKYLIGADGGHMRYVAHFWPNEAVVAAAESLHL